MFVLIGINESFLFSSIKWWKSLPLEIRTSSSLGIFMHSLLKYWQFPTRNCLFYFGDRSASIPHARLPLNFSALKYHLFQKNCCLSPACPLSDAPVEDPKLFSVLSKCCRSAFKNLFTSAAQLPGYRWYCASNKKKLIGS